MAPDGVLTTIDVESELLGHARRNFAAAGLSSHRTRLIAGRALDVLPRMAARGYDMVVLDAPGRNAPVPGPRRAHPAPRRHHRLRARPVARPGRRPRTPRRTHRLAREVVNYLRDSDEFVPTLLPVGDGLAVAVKR